ncbi:hypothetical protein [uncultured Clostridium sp.]|uniref:hypothetical protein n=1 Tax=uncultured Clostridium sp. TaxID=59620 RepID=UPI00262A74FB|nr:hypothetical protein [uncultured Clostridium sp.]
MRKVKRTIEFLGIIFLLAFIFYSYRYYKINSFMDTGISNANSGEYEEAVECFNEVINRDKDNKLAKKSIEEIKDYLLADDLYLKGKIEEANKVILGIVKNGVDWNMLKEDIDALEEKIDDAVEKQIQKKELTCEEGLKLIEENDGEFLDELLRETYYKVKPRIWCDLKDTGEEGKGLRNGINIFKLPIQEAYIFYVDSDYTMAVYIVDKIERNVYRMPNQGGGVGYLMKKDKIIKEYPAVE